MFKRFISLLLALLCLSFVPALAYSGEFYSVDREEIDLGVPDVPAQDCAPIRPQSRAASGTEMFSFAGTNVAELVVTSSPKYFTQSSLSNGYLQIVGSASYETATSGLKYRVGGCYWNSSSSIYKTSVGQYAMALSGVSVNTSLSKSNFDSQHTYYGFLRNLNSYGSSNRVSGSFTFYNSSI